MPNRHTLPPVAVAALILGLAGAPCRAGEEAPAGGLFAPEWPQAEPPPAVPRTVRGAADGDWGSLTANSVLGDAASPCPAWDDPPSDARWKTNEDWRLVP